MLFKGKYTTSSMLYEGYNNAFGDAKKNILEKTISLLEDTKSYNIDLIKELNTFIKNTNSRYLIIDFPDTLEINLGNLDDFTSKLDYGIYPGNATVDKFVKYCTSFSFFNNLTLWAIDGDIKDKILRGPFTCTIDTVELLSELGKYYRTDDITSDTYNISIKCLNKVVELTENDENNKKRLEALLLLSKMND